jgi:hypothetical protein
MGKVWEKYGKSMGKIWEKYGKVRGKYRKYKLHHSSHIRLIRRVTYKTVWNRVSDTRYDSRIGWIWQRYEKK